MIRKYKICRVLLSVTTVFQLALLAKEDEIEADFEKQVLILCTYYMILFQF